MASKVLDVDLAYGPQDINGLLPYRTALVLLRWRGRPLGQMRMDVAGGRIIGMDLWQMACAVLGKRLVEAALDDMLPKTDTPAPGLTLPSCSVVICTRNRTDDLRRCLDSLCAAAEPEVEIIVVDNAPSDDRTARLVANYPVRYVREDRVGLNWARSRGARAATGDIVIYTDDDTVLDPHWVSAILEPFDRPHVAAVTGLTMPLELETEAQEWFEVYGGFGRGFRRRVFDCTTLAPVAAGVAGAGVNMALRRELINELGLFDAELDCGTITQTGGDTYAFYRLLAAGYQIVYTPEALVWHRHRRDYASLRKTLAGYSVGVYAFLTRCWLQHGDWQAPAVAASWFWHDHLRQLVRSIRCQPRALPLDLVLAQIVAILQGPWAYVASRRREHFNLYVPT